MTSFYAVDEAAATGIAGKKDSTEIASEISFAGAAVADEVKRYDDAMKDARIELYVCGFTRAAVDAVDPEVLLHYQPRNTGHFILDSARAKGLDAQLVELQDFLALGWNDRVAGLLWRRAIDDLSLTGQQPSRFALSADLVEESFPVNKVPDLSLFDGIAPMEWVDRTSRSGLADTTLKLFKVGDGIWKRWRQNHFRLEQEERTASGFL